MNFRKVSYLISVSVFLILIISCQISPHPPKTQLDVQLVSVKQIKDSRHHQIVGYLEEELVRFSPSSSPYRRFNVKNKFWELKGFVLENGQSYQYDEKGNALHIGNYTLELGIRKILGIEPAIYFDDFIPTSGFED